MWGSQLVTGPLRAATDKNLNETLERVFKNIEGSALGTGSEDERKGEKEIRAQISRAVDASPTLRRKRDLVEDFVDSISVDGAVAEQRRAFTAAKPEAELEPILEEQKLRPEQTRAFVESAYREGQLRTSGTGITKILPPVSRFASDGGHGAKKKNVVEALTHLFERFFGLAPGGVE